MDPFLTLIYLSSWISFVSGVLIALHDPQSWRVTSALVYSIFISSLFLLIEYLQYRGSSASTYLSSPWNFLQVLSYSCMIFSSILIFLENNAAFEGVFGTVFAGWTNIILGFNFLSFLRPYSWSGPLIRMLIQIVQDMLPFLILQLIMLFSFTVGFMTMLTESDLYQGIKSFFKGYTMLLGDFDVEEFQVESSKAQTDSALIAFSMYMLFGPIVTMNLLIAIMGDSYDFVRENQRLYGLKEKAKALYDIDHTFFTIEYLRKDKYFPKYLHVLTRKDGDSIDDEEEKWEGHLKKLQREMKNNTKEMTEKMEKEMLEMKTELKKEITEKIENNSKELKEQMENNSKEMSEKIENNSKEMKEDMKDLESKLDQILELLSKSQNPD